MRRTAVASLAVLFTRWAAAVGLRSYDGGPSGSELRSKDH
jgi:hypothetical protein